MINTHENRMAEQQAPKAFRVALNILEKWKCSAEQKQHILGLTRSTFFKYQSNCDSAKLTHDQIERISYVLNIHQTLGMVFSNPENRYGFMKMVNHNPYFNGKTPLELIASGSFGVLYEVFKRIDAMRSGQW